MSGRKLLADALKAALPTWQVVSTARPLDSVKKPGAVVLWTSRIEKAPALGLHWFREECVLWVLTAADKPDAIEDDLDDLLYQVMQALEPLDSFAWDVAERDVLAETFHGYRMTITCLWKAEQEEEEAP